MPEANVYSTPEALVDDRSDEVYQPRFFSTDGRIGRLRYLAYFTGVYFIAMMIITVGAGGMGAIGAASGNLTQDAAGVGGLIIAGAAYLFMIVMGFIFAKRRFNDLNKSGWFVLLNLIPFINILVAIYMVFFPGTDGPNRWGAPPAANTLGVKILGLLFPAIAIIGIVAAIALPAYQDYSQRAQQAMEQQQ